MSDERVPDLYKLAYAPGLFRCPKCNFQLSKQTINVALGTISTTEDNRQSEECPNDGTMMVHMTYEELCRSANEMLDQKFVEIEKLKSDLNARIAAAQAATLKLASEHQAGDYNGGDYDWVCECGAVGHWSIGCVDSWANHILSLLPAAQKAAEERDAKVFHDTLDDLADNPNLIVGGKVPVRVFSEKGLKERDALLVAGATKAACEIIHRLPYEEYLDNRKLEIQIENITPASALAALAEFARKERVACAKTMAYVYGEEVSDEFLKLIIDRELDVIENDPLSKRIASLSPAEPQKEGK